MRMDIRCSVTFSYIPQLANHLGRPYLGVRPNTAYWHVASCRLAQIYNCSKTKYGCIDSSIMMITWSCNDPTRKILVLERLSPTDHRPSCRPTLECLSRCDRVLVLSWHNGIGNAWEFDKCIKICVTRWLSGINEGVSIVITLCWRWLLLLVVKNRCGAGTLSHGCL